MQEKELLKNTAVEDQIVDTLRKLKPRIKKVKKNLHQDGYLLKRHDDEEINFQSPKELKILKSVLKKDLNFSSNV